MTSNPLDVLVIGWYPAADDSFAGRFIADQVGALAATGRVRPAVATFENLPLGGDERLRLRQDAAIDANIAQATHAPGGGFAAEGAFGARDVPVARLGIAAGAAPGLGADHQEVHRRRSLLALIDASPRRWQLVHGHVGYPEGAAAAAAAARLGVPFVLTEHATYLATFFADPVLRRRYLEAARTAARIVPVSHVLAAELAAEFPELAPKIVPIPNTVAIDSFRVVPIEARRSNELLWVGYRKSVKGIDTLLRAFALVHRDRGELRLRLVGRSSTEDEELGWRQLAEELGVAGSVTFDGPADRAGVAAAMERATLFIHPSTRETFGVVAVEALSTGLPVVACDSGGVTEVLGDHPGSLGEIVPHSDPDALGRAILATLDRRAGFDPLAMRGAVEARFGTRAVADRIVALYDEVLAEAPVVREHGSSGARQRGRGAGNDRLAAARVPAEVTRVAADAALIRAGSVDRTISPRHVVVGFQRSLLERHLAAAPTWVLAGAEVVTTGDPLPSQEPGMRAEAGRSGRSADSSERRGDAGEATGLRAFARVTVASHGTGRRLVELVRWGMPPTGVQSLGWRTRRALLLPLRWIRRARRRVWLEDAVLGELTQALARGIDPEFADDRGRPVVLVCMAGVDHLVARPFVERGDATIAQAALRWLADARWAERPADGTIDASATGSAADPVGRYPPRRPGGGPLSSSTSAR